MELQEPNAGRDPFTFLKRGRLPKATSSPVLGARPDPAAFYQAADLRIGSVVSVHGRHFYLFDMDAASRKWYQASTRLPAGEHIELEKGAVGWVVVGGRSTWLTPPGPPPALCCHRSTWAARLRSWRQWMCPCRGPHSPCPRCLPGTDMVRLLRVPRHSRDWA